MTDADRLQQVESLFHDALARPSGERAIFLAAVCGADAALLSHVRALLAAHERSGDFIDLPIAGLAAERLMPEPAVSLAGRQLGAYRVLGLLGRGGMGEVYLAEDTRLGRRVAIKFLPAEFVNNTDRLRRFEREARAASSLNHPNIVTVHDVGLVDDGRFIVSEYIEGRTLREHLAAGKMSVEEALRTALQIAAALSAAHTAGIIHRDIKPENVMLRRDGLVKVLDFGLAKLTEVGDLRSAETSTNPGQVMGTVSYMSPEQARGLDVDARADIWSLGVVLYEMSVGQPPFSGRTIAEVFAALLDQAPPPLRVSLPAAPDDLQEIISRALEKDCEARYQSVSDFAADLERLRHNIESGAEIHTPPPSPQLPSRHNQPDGAPPESRAGQRARRASRTAWFRHGGLLPAVLALLAGLGWGVFKVGGSLLARGPVATPVTMAFSSAPGSKNFACFSPDGSQLAYTWDGALPERKGKFDIYIKVIGAGEPLRLTTAPEDDVQPAWSPDGRYIAFLRDYIGSRSNYGVFLVPALGGAERKLTDAYSGPSWSPDGKMLAICSPGVASHPSGVALYSIETGEQRRLTTATPDFTDLNPTFSPDGRSIAFVRRFGLHFHDLYVIPTAGGTPKRITFDKHAIDGLTWTADSREIVYSANRTDGRNLWRVPVSGGTAQRIFVTGQNPSFPTISRQGSRLAYLDCYFDFNIYQLEGLGFAGRDVPGRFGAPKIILLSSREDSSPQFSPDGAKIVFVSQRGGNEEIWVSDGEGKNPVQLTSLSSLTGTPRWSPDGLRIAFDSLSRGSADIYLISAEGGAVRQVTTEPSAESVPSWSRDGRWLYFNSDRSGKREIWKMPVGGGPAIQLTHGGGFEGFESPDGKLFYFSKGHHVYGIWSIPIEGGEAELVPELKQVGYWRSWGVVNEGIYFLTKEETPRQTVKFFSFATRQITPLATVEKEPVRWLPSLTLSPDGRRLLYAQQDHEVYDILLMENFR